jgi:hypothetical protein
LSDQYGSTAYKATYNKGTPRFHTLKGALAFILLQSIPWTIVGAIPVAIVDFMLFIVLGLMFKDGPDHLPSIFLKLATCVSIVLAYLIGFKYCIKHLMDEHAQTFYVGSNRGDLRSLMARTTAHAMLGRSCVVEAPSYLKLLFSKEGS